MRAEFIRSIEENKETFELELSAEQVSRLADFFEIVMEHNDLLHLVAPSSPAEFAVRHVLESLTLLKSLPSDVIIADIGPGAGFPSIPCLLVREDISARMIESKEKKIKYLEKAAIRLGIAGRTELIDRQFEETVPGNATIITCRALDKFVGKLPKMLKWSKGRKLLLFGGPSLRDGLARSSCKFTEQLMPMSEQRYLFTVEAAQNSITA